MVKIHVYPFLFVRTKKYICHDSNENDTCSLWDSAQVQRQSENCCSALFGTVISSCWSAHQALSSKMITLLHVNFEWTDCEFNEVTTKSLFCSFKPLKALKGRYSIFGAVEQVVYEHAVQACMHNWKTKTFTLILHGPKDPYHWYCWTATPKSTVTIIIMYSYWYWAACRPQVGTREKCQRRLFLF